MKVGILGGGQLARMIALAGHELGFQFITLDPTMAPCAASVSQHFMHDYNDTTALKQLAELADVVTFEFENVPAASAELIESFTPIYPSPVALTSTQDRLVEKTLFQELDISTADFAVINSLADLQTYACDGQWPAILKTRSEGYDGKGQVIIKSPDDIESAWHQIKGAPAILEAFVPFEREISIIAARSTHGETCFYPLSENSHENGILKFSIARANDPMQSLAEDYVSRLLDRLNYVGIIALELFQTKDALLANEYAPRVHNTGHWTMEGAETCQFENHIRAILGLPLGSTALIGHAAMFNLIGKPPEITDILSISHAHLHLYDKEPRCGRKIGHINLRCDDKLMFNEQLNLLLNLTKLSNC